MDPGTGNFFSAIWDLIFEVAIKQLITEAELTGAVHAAIRPLLEGGTTHCSLIKIVLLQDGVAITRTSVVLAVDDNVALI